MCTHTFVWFFWLDIYQAQKAKDKEENEEFIQQLDKDFSSLVQSQALSSLAQPKKMSALKSIVSNSISNDNVKKEDAPITQNKVSILHVHFYLTYFYSFP